MKFLSNLIDAMGVSGHEDEVRKLIESEIKGHVDEIHTDKIGNLIAHRWGQRPRVMLAAHMDEIGMIVKVIDSRGMIHCSDIGSIKPIVIIGQHVHVHTKGGRVIHGVVTTANLSDGWDKEQSSIKTEDIIVDTGLSKAELEKRGVEVGCPIEMHEVLNLLGSDEVISGKALDNRIGCFILVEVAKRLSKVQSDIYYVFTVQEEFGLLGSAASAYKIEPDWAIAVDVTSTNEFSDAPSKHLGKGPCLMLKNEDTITNSKLNAMIREAADANNIPLQLEVTDSGTTDAFSIALTKGGVPTAIINVPVRNLETAIGIAHKSDIQNTIRLLEELLKNPKPSLL